MTRKELHKIKAQALMNNAIWKQGYCCYQDDHLGRCELTELGHNKGIYGWNWTLYYYPPTNTYYLSYYRNI